MEVIMCKNSVTAICLLFLASRLIAQWEPDLRLTHNNETSIYPDITIGSEPGYKNNIHVVWSDGRSSYPIYYKRSVNYGSDWDPDVNIASHYFPADFASPKVTCFNENIHVAWSEETRTSYTHSTDNGTSWPGDTTLASQVEGCTGANISVSNSDYVHLVWADGRDLWIPSIFYKRSSDNGQTWGVDWPMAYDSSTQICPAITGCSSYVHVVWSDYREGNSEIYYRRSSNNGSSWMSHINLTNTAASQHRPSISVSGASVHVVWYDNQNGDYDIYHLRSINNGITWGSISCLTNNSSDQSFPKICVRNDIVHVVWQDNRNGNSDIYYLRSTDNGVTWEPEICLTTDSNSSEFPSIDAQGSYVHVVWQDDRDGNWEIYYKRNPVGNQGIKTTESEAMAISDNQLVPKPNPFIRSTTIQGYEERYFAIYDVQGRYIGMHKGSSIGYNLKPGIYFLRNDTHHMNLRILKVQ
jgi:hypothetical protein